MTELDILHGLTLKNMMLFRSLNSSITYFLSHIFLNIKVDSHGSWPIEKALTLHNVIILIKSVLNKDHYYYKILLDTCLYQLVKKETPFFVRSIIMLTFGEKERNSKRKVLCCRKSYKNLGS